MFTLEIEITSIVPFKIKELTDRHLVFGQKRKLKIVGLIVILMGFPFLIVPVLSREILLTSPVDKLSEVLFGVIIVSIFSLFFALTLIKSGIFAVTGSYKSTDWVFDKNQGYLYEEQFSRGNGVIEVAKYPLNEITHIDVNVIEVLDDGEGVKSERYEVRLLCSGKYVSLFKGISGVGKSEEECKTLITVFKNFLQLWELKDQK